MTENSPGRAAYEAWLPLAYDTCDNRPWDKSDARNRDAWEAAAQAAIKAARPEPSMTDGRAAYEAYSSQSAGKSLVSGDPLPGWDGLPYAIKIAWGYAALEGSLAATGGLAEQILENTGDEWDGDEAIEAIAVNYVRYLEDRVNSKPVTTVGPAPELAAADRATAEFRRQCSELAGELGAARAVVREMDAHIADGDDYADPAKRAEWRQRAGIGDGQ